MLSLGVLCSGRGSNLQAILDACADGSLPAQVKVVISNKPDAQALTRAAAAGIPSVVVDKQDYPHRLDYDTRLLEILTHAGVEVVVLAGFMRLLSPVLLDPFQDRILNVHPALLPSFAGLDAQQQTLDRRVTIAGCTVHLVDEGMDTGPIVAQAAVPVLPGDDRERLAARILRQEHRLMVEVLRWMAAGLVRTERDGQKVTVHVDGKPRAFWADEP